MKLYFYKKYIKKISYFIFSIKIFQKYFLNVNKIHNKKCLASKFLFIYLFISFCIQSTSPRFAVMQRYQFCILCYFLFEMLLWYHNFISWKSTRPYCIRELQYFKNSFLSKKKKKNLNKKENCIKYDI